VGWVDQRDGPRIKRREFGLRDFAAQNQSRALRRDRELLAMWAGEHQVHIHAQVNGAPRSDYRGHVLTRFEHSHIQKVRAACWLWRLWAKVRSRGQRNGGDAAGIDSKEADHFTANGLR